MLLITSLSVEELHRAIPHVRAYATVVAACYHQIVNPHVSHNDHNHHNSTSKNNNDNTTTTYSSGNANTRNDHAKTRKPKNCTAVTNGH